MNDMTSAEVAKIEADLYTGVAKELAAITGQSWVAVHSIGNCGRIAGPDNLGISMSLNSRDKDKVVIHGVLERDPPVHGSIAYGEGNPSIQVARKRGADVIAKEIMRRVLPGYKVVFAKNREIQQRHQEYASTTHAARERMARAFGVVPHEREQEQFWAGNTRIQVGGNSVTLEIRSVSVDLAEKIAHLLAAKEGMKS